MLQEIKSDRIYVTFYDDNIRILLQRQRFSQKFSSTHKVICPCDVSPWRVPQLQIVLAWPAQTEWYVATTCCCNLPEQPDWQTISCLDNQSNQPLSDNQNNMYMYKA